MRGLVETHGKIEFLLSWKSTKKRNGAKSIASELESGKSADRSTVTTIPVKSFEKPMIASYSCTLTILRIAFFASVLAEKNDFMGFE